MNIYEFAALNRSGKMLALKKGCFCDTFEEGSATVYVYYLGNFFVEEIIKDGEVIDMIPFKRGYKVPWHGMKKVRGSEYEQAA